MGVNKKYYPPHEHTFDVELLFRQNYIPIQAFQTNVVKKRLAFINEENFKNVIALQLYFPVRPKNAFKLLGQCSPVRLLKARAKLTLGSISHTMTVCVAAEVVLLKHSCFVFFQTDISYGPRVIPQSLQANGGITLTRLRPLPFTSFSTEESLLNQSHVVTRLVELLTYSLHVTGQHIAILVILACKVTCLFLLLMI